MIETISKRTKYILILFYITLSFIAFIFAIGIAQYYERDPLSIELHNGGKAKYVHAGEYFTFSRDICVGKDIAISVHREFHSLETGKKYMLYGISYIAYKKDGCYVAEFTTKAPENMPPGQYEYRPILIYWVNEKLEIIKPAPIVEIEVLGD